MIQNNKVQKGQTRNQINPITYLHQLKKKLAANRTTVQASKSNDDTQESHQTLDDASALSESEGRVTAVVAKVKYEATKS